MNWNVITTACFDCWFAKQDDEMQEKVLAGLVLLARLGVSLARPFVDTVKGSRFSNMKELRIQHKGNPVRAFFAFDPLRQAVVLCAGCKKGNDRFYDEMLPLADREFSKHLNKQKGK